MKNRLSRPDAGGGLIVALIVIMLAPVVVATAMIVVTSGRKAVEQEHVKRGKAVSIAQAGLVDALSWFRRQTVQPVVNFDPQQDLIADPPINDSDLPAVGIVRTFSLGTYDGLWVRYEVRRTDIRDITQDIGLAGAGAAWRVESIGFVFYNPTNDPAVATMDVPPNIVTSVRLSTEYRRLTTNLPVNAAILGSAGATMTISTRARVAGGAPAYGIAYPQGTGAPAITGEVTGLAPQMAVDPLTYLTDTASVFGVDEATLRGMSDLLVNDVSELPETYPSMALVFIDGNAVFDDTRPLVGGGILYVTGNLTINDAASFSGLIYVEGNYSQSAPAVIYGSAVVGGSVNAAGVGGDYTEFYYDDGALTQIRAQIGQYRISRPPYLVESVCPFNGERGVFVILRCETDGTRLCERDLVGGNCPNCGLNDFQVQYEY